MMADSVDKGWNHQQVWESLIDWPTKSSPRVAYDETPLTELRDNMLYMDEHEDFELYPSESKEYALLSDGQLEPPKEAGEITRGQKGSPLDELQEDSILKESQLQQPEISEIFSRETDPSFTFADDVESSLGSSFYTDVLTSSCSSSISRQMESITGSAAYLSPPIGGRSRSSSLRTGSLRNTSSGTTPRTRHTFVSSNSCGEGILSCSISNEDKLKRKREFHNAVERRRRELIKLKIKELGKIIPPSLLNYDDSGKQVKPNKSIILNKTVEYLEYLLRVLETQDQRKGYLLERFRELESKSRNLKTLRKRPPPELMQNDQKQHQQHYLSVDPTCSPHNVLDGNDILNAATVCLQHPLRQQFTTDTKWNRKTSTSDDLQQFLSGDLIEAEDNAKLIFGDGSANPTDYLLDFDS